MFHQTPLHSLTLLSCENQPTFHISPLILHSVRTAQYRPQQASPNTEKALQHNKLLQQTHMMMRHYLQQTSERIQHQIDKKSKMAPQLKKRDKVYFLTKNWKTKKPKTKKLDNIKVRLFLVEKKTGPVNIKIRLPRDARVYPNFHILMIKPADQSTPLQETFHYQPEEEQKFEVKQILAKKSQ